MVEIELTTTPLHLLMMDHRRKSAVGTQRGLLSVTALLNTKNGPESEMLPVGIGRLGCPIRHLQAGPTISSLGSGFKIRVGLLGRGGGDVPAVKKSAKEGSGVRTKESALANVTGSSLSPLCASSTRLSLP